MWPTPRGLVAKFNRNLSCSRRYRALIETQCQVGQPSKPALPKRGLVSGYLNPETINLPDEPWQQPISRGRAKPRNEVIQVDNLHLFTPLDAGSYANCATSSLAYQALIILWRPSVTVMVGVQSSSCCAFRISLM